MKKRLINFFLVIREHGYFIFFTIFSALWIGVFVQMFNNMGGFEPPTQQDYKWLHEQGEKIKESFENVYLLKNAYIRIQNSEIKIILVSETDANYELHMTFDKNKEFIESNDICNKEGFRTYSLYPEFEKYFPIIQCICAGLLIASLSALCVQLIYDNIYDRIKRKR